MLFLSVNVEFLNVENPNLNQTIVYMNLVNIIYYNIHITIISCTQVIYYARVSSHTPISISPKYESHNTYLCEFIRYRILYEWSFLKWVFIHPNEFRNCILYLTLVCAGVLKLFFEHT
jgi:hypothetical protein